MIVGELTLVLAGVGDPVAEACPLGNSARCAGRPAARARATVLARVVLAEFGTFAGRIESGERAVARFCVPSWSTG